MADKPRYFNPEEIEEGDFVNSTTREKRPPKTFKSGAIYEGEWIGVLRDGYGIQTWPDGARYQGKKKLNAFTEKNFI